ncbi:MAG TPA: triose-phosphate isomerase [Patescibacteria group bacterium]|nr:triose-phosphate isomerase [Patescibacteria group bacterium]
MNPENIKAFLSKENIAGGLVGQACLDADTFLQLISKSA